MKNTLKDCTLLFVDVREKTKQVDASLYKALAPMAKDDAFGSLVQELRHVSADSPVLAVAVAGEYSVGKSSLIEALTGETLETDGDVTTQNVDMIRYRDDLMLIDMPGMLSGQLAHDRKAYKAIMDSDLLLFVVTNELFNAESLPYFKRTVEEFRKDRQTLIVVNQFDRVNLTSRSAETAIAAMTSALEERLAPIPVEQFSPVFVSARDYLDALDEGDPEERRELLIDSRLDTLVKAIDELCLERGAAGRLARPLQVRLRIVNDAIAAATKDGDGAQRLTLEYLHRRLGIYGQVQRSANLEVLNLKATLKHNIRRLSEPVVFRIENQAEAEEIRSAWADADAEALNAYQQAICGLEAIVASASNSLADKLLELNESPTGVALNQILRKDLDSRGDAGTMAAPSKDMAGDLARKLGVSEMVKRGGKELAAKSEEISRALVEQIAKFRKFRPWGKIKLGEALEKWLGRLGKGLPFLAIAFEGYLNYRDEREAEERERERLRFKAKVREALTQTAVVACKAIDDTYAGIDALFKAEIADMHDKREALARAAEDKAELLTALAGIGREIGHILQLLNGARNQPE